MSESPCPTWSRRSPSIVTSSASSPTPRKRRRRHDRVAAVRRHRSGAAGPATPDSPIAKFLAKRGPGIHHICYRVPDLDAALDACRAAGYRLVDETPRSGAGGRRIAFVHPKATAGILLELTE